MKVSVVIPMYNAGRWIRETLESIYNQNYRRDDIQILITDDESTDDGPNIARAFFEERSMNGQLVPNKRNGGCGAPRNAATHLVTSDWVQYVDADDILQPNKFDLQTTAAKHAPTMSLSSTRRGVTTYSKMAPGSRGGPWWRRSSTTTRWCVFSATPSLGSLGRPSFENRLRSRSSSFNGSIMLGEDFDFHDPRGDGRGALSTRLLRRAGVLVPVDSGFDVAQGSFPHRAYEAVRADLAPRRALFAGAAP